MNPCSSAYNHIYGGRGRGLDQWDTDCECKVRIWFMPPSHLWCFVSFEKRSIRRIDSGNKLISLSDCSGGWPLLRGFISGLYRRLKRLMHSDHLANIKPCIPMYGSFIVAVPRYMFFISVLFWWRLGSDGGVDWDVFTLLLVFATFCVAEAENGLRLFDH